jgi:hypothetical protein
MPIKLTGFFTTVNSASRQFIREKRVLDSVMNIYDQKSVRCSKCDRFIGEIDYDAVITLPKCGHCANPLPEGDDKVQYIVSKFNKNPKSLARPLDSTS